MKKRLHPGTGLGDGGVIGHDHVHRQRPGPTEGLLCCDAVVHGDQQPDALGMQTIHHGWVEAIALVHAGGDRGFRLGSKWFKGPQQKSGTGHPIGVVIAADRQCFTVCAGLTDPIDGDREIRKMAAGIRQFRRTEQVCHLCFAQSATKQQCSQWKG